MRPYLAVLVLVAGCAGPGGEFRALGTPPVVAVTSARTGDRGDVLAAYREFQRVFESALATNDSSEIPLVADEPVAGNITEQVERQQWRGVLRRSHSALSPKILLRKGDRAEVLDCVTASGFSTYDARTGKRVGKRPVGERGLLHATLRHDGSWKVVGLELLERKC